MYYKYSMIQWQYFFMHNHFYSTLNGGNTRQQPQHVPISHQEAFSIRTREHTQKLCQKSKFKFFHNKLNVTYLALLPPMSALLLPATR